MCRNLFPVFTIVLLIITCLFGGCVNNSEKGTEVPSLSTPPITDGGLAQIEQEPLPQSFSLSGVRKMMRPGEINSLSPFSNATRILSIQGVNLDGAGNAGHWIFSVDNAGINEMVVYDRSGWTVLPLNRGINAEEINLDRVITPDALFSQNQLRIVAGSPRTTPIQRDIELKNGTYTLTTTYEGSSSVLRFNATTGAMME